MWITFIRYNPDTIKNKEHTVKIAKTERFNKLIETVKFELYQEPETFEVRLIQLCYNDDYDVYQDYKFEDYN